MRAACRSAWSHGRGPASTRRGRSGRRRPASTTMHISTPCMSLMRVGAHAEIAAPMAPSADRQPADLVCADAVLVGVSSASGSAGHNEMVSRGSRCCLLLTEPPTEYDADGGLTTSFHSLADVAAITLTVSFDSPAAQRSPPSATAGATVGAWALQNGAHARSGPSLPEHTKQPNGEAAAPVSSPPVQASKAGPAPDVAGARAQSETRLMATPPRQVRSGLGPPRPASTGPPPRTTAGVAAGAD